MILLLSNHFLVAQNPYSYTIDKSVGLSSNAVYDIFQDNKGFMWFATDDGLNRYDGTKFRCFTAKNQTSKSGSNIIEDKYGRVWYVNFDGNLYYVQNERLHAFRQNNSIGYYEFGIIDNKLFTVQKDSIEIFDLKDFRLIKKIKFDATFFKATHLSDKHFYIFTNQLLKIDSDLKISKINLPQTLLETKSIVVESDRDDLFIVSKTNGELYRYGNGTFTKEAVLEGNIVQNLNFVDNRLWLATTSGLFEYKDKHFVNYYKEINVSSIFKDRENKFWISTLTDGILYIPNFSSILWKFRYKPVTLFSNGKTVAVGYENDVLSEFDPNSFTEKILYKGTSNHVIYKIFVDKNHYFISSNNFKIFNKNIEEVNIAVKDITKIDDKFYAFAASGLCGLFSLDNEKTSEWDVLNAQYVTDTSSNLKESKILVGVRGKSVAYNPVNKTIYFATSVGLYAQTKTQQKEIKYNKQSLFCQKIYYYNNYIFLLSNESELLKLDSLYQISEVNIDKNIIRDGIENIKLIGSNLYIFTNNCIFKFDLSSGKTTKIQNITPNISVSDIATTGQKTILATSSGLVIKSNANLNDELLPKFILNQVLVNDQPKKSTHLDYNENNLSFDFSVLAYLPNTKFPISYKINNGKWITLEDHQRSLRLSSLAAGEYSLLFKIENLEKTSQNIIRYHFSIQKPFWESFLFILLSVLVLAAIFYFIYKSKIRNIHRKNQLELTRINLENNLNQSKLTAIKSQMNPHFFYNALNTIQSYILSNEKKEAINYLNKFSSLTRTILELTEKNYLSIKEEIKTIILYLDLEKARFNDDFSYTISIDEDIDTESVKIPSMLLQPFIENAIKHGLLHQKGEKKLIITIRKTEDCIQISIDDNGIGRKRSAELNRSNRKKHISFATDAIEKRLEILNHNKTRKITVQYIDKQILEESIGTTVIINIPILWK